MNLYTVGTAERCGKVVPVVTAQSVARSFPGVQRSGAGVMTCMEELQATMKAVVAWLPPDTPVTGERLWLRVLADKLRAWSPELNKAVAGLGLFDNNWALIYDRARAFEIVRSGYDQPSAAALRKKVLKLQLQSLTPADTVQEYYFQQSVLNVDLGESTPWFITMYSNHESVEFGESVKQNKAS